MGSASPTVASGSGAEHTSHDDAGILGGPLGSLGVCIGICCTVHPEGGTGVACLQARLEIGILDCWSGAVSLADWLNLAQLQLHPGSRSIRDVTCSSGMSSSLRDVLVAPGCHRHFGAAVTNLGRTSSASSVLHSSLPLWEHRLLSSRSFITPFSIQVRRCTATPNLQSILSIREVRSQPETVRVQGVSPGPATQRSQSSGCLTRSHPETSSLSLDSGVQNGRRSCERETPDRFVSQAWRSAFAAISDPWLQSPPRWGPEAVVLMKITRGRASGRW
jgi:hypothetical protein